MSDKRFLVKNEALIGRKKEDGSDHPPVELIFYTMVEAPNLEAANDMLVTYSDPGFRTRVANVLEVADSLSSDDLYSLLKLSDVVQEMTG
jgi:hypothetical protein